MTGRISRRRTLALAGKGVVAVGLPAGLVAGRDGRAFAKPAYRVDFDRLAYRVETATGVIEKAFFELYPSARGIQANGVGPEFRVRQGGMNLTAIKDLNLDQWVAVTGSDFNRNAYLDAAEIGHFAVAYPGRRAADGEIKSIRLWSEASLQRRAGTMVQFAANAEVATDAPMAAGGYMVDGGISLGGDQAAVMAHVLQALSQTLPDDPVIASLLRHGTSAGFSVADDGGDAAGSDAGDAGEGSGGM